MFSLLGILCNPCDVAGIAEVLASAGPASNESLLEALLFPLIGPVGGTASPFDVVRYSKSDRVVAARLGDVTPVGS